MSDYTSGAYYIRRRARGGGKRAVGILITALLLLSAATCLLVWFLPRINFGSSEASGGVSQKTFYMLTVGGGGGRDEALVVSSETLLRGGAGYVFNDGEYRVIAAVYDSEADARALASVNDNASYFSLSVSLPHDSDDGTLSAFEYMTGEWFSTVMRTADELQRKNITEAQAEHAVRSACRKLAALGDKAEDRAVSRACLAASEYDCPKTVAPLAYIHYVHVRGIAELYLATSE